MLSKFPSIFCRTSNRLLLKSGNGNRGVISADYGVTLMFDESTYCIVEKLVDKKVCIASFDLVGLFSTAKIG